MLPPVSVAGRFAAQAAADGAEGEVCAVLRMSAYARFAADRYVCLGEPSLGAGPLNALIEGFRPPAVGERLVLDLRHAAIWTPPALAPGAVPDLGLLRTAARGRTPAEGLGGLVVDAHNSLSGHAQPALDAIERWLVGNALEEEAAMLIGLGPGFTPAGDNYLAGVLIALHRFERQAQGQALWRWLAPRLARTSAISRAHCVAAAEGEGHESLHLCLQTLCASDCDLAAALAALDAAGWDSLAGIVAVAKSAA